MSLFILTGAGLSAESGVATFRDANGLWENHDLMAVASAEGFASNPVLVHRFYDTRRAQLDDIEPNTAHHALARLQQFYRGKVTLVTQNVDDLHERAGSTVMHMHGQLRLARCQACDHRLRWQGSLQGAECPICQGALRPDIVWFGEVPMHLDAIESALADCTLFVAIGTSGSVYPAAGFVDAARHFGARTLEINLEASAGGRFDHVRLGPATREVPAWVTAMLS